MPLYTANYFSSTASKLVLECLLRLIQFKNVILGGEDQFEHSREELGGVRKRMNILVLFDKIKRVNVRVER